MDAICKLVKLHTVFVTANNSSSYVCLIIHDKISLTVKNCTSPLKLHCSGSAQTKSSLEHGHNACSEFFVAAWHLTHKSSFVILRRNRECFICMASRHALTVTSSPFMACSWTKSASKPVYLHLLLNHELSLSALPPF